MRPAISRVFAAGIRERFISPLLCIYEHLAMKLSAGYKIAIVLMFLIPVALGAIHHVYGVGLNIPAPVGYIILAMAIIYMCWYNLYQRRLR
jgi:hypothetical protein